MEHLKVQDILKLPFPKTQHELHSLHEMVNFLCQFLLDYTTQAHKFTHLLYHGILFQWDGKDRYSFYSLKQILTQAPLFSPPKFNWDFILYVSTSSFVTMEVLIQEVDY